MVYLLSIYKGMPLGVVVAYAMQLKERQKVDLLLDSPGSRHGNKATLVKDKCWMHIGTKLTLGHS